VTFYPKGLLISAGFAGVLILAVNARAGNIDPRFFTVGSIAILIVEVVMFFGPLTRRRIQSK